jgi:phenylacetate-coenzyme A ligase PaaK-like adenylate-forming protein
MIAYEDDASRKILSIGEFDNATTENVKNILNEVEEHVKMFNALIEAINTDRGKMGTQNQFSKII